MSIEQLDLFAETPPDTPLTVADIDEWIAVTRNVTNPHCAGHYPNEWAREALGAVLGEDIQPRRWTTSELLATLTRARKVVGTA